MVSILAGLLNTEVHEPYRGHSEGKADCPWHPFVVSEAEVIRLKGRSLSKEGEKNDGHFAPVCPVSMSTLYAE